MGNKAAHVVINLVQDIATPHNNTLIEQFLGLKDVKINLWYAEEENKKLYRWSKNLTHEHFPAEIYGRKLNIKFIRYCLLHKHERYVIVGWANTNTRLLHLIFFLMRRPFNHWTDLPNPKQEDLNIKHKILRWTAYRLLRHSKCKIFGVGKTTMDGFRAWGFPLNLLVNMPIFVSVDEDIEGYRAKRSELLSNYSVPKDGFLLTAGSRLVFDKGYDLLIQAVAEVPSELLKKIKLVIVGNGEEFSSLRHQIDTLELNDVVQMKDWLDIYEFKAIIANSDIFIHPARFDSYGGTTLGMALGVPVVGSKGAGAAVDRIDHGVNGFLYEPGNTKALAGYITRLLQNAELRKRLGDAGRQTALQWPPSRGVDILVQNSI